MANEVDKSAEKTTKAVKGMGLSLTDLIAGLIQSTVDADQAVTDDYMRTFKEYAFEKNSKGGNDRLQMVDFEMVDSEGVRRLVSIPKLSLLPLPVLHVSEATFDIDAKITATANEETEEEVLPDAEPTLPARASILRKPLTATRGTLNPARYSLAFEADTGKKKTTKKKSGGQTESVLNAKIHIELRPTTLSSGMRSALQLVDSTVREQIIE